MSLNELKKSLSALFALQKEYVQLVEEESPDHAEAIGYYIELLEELKTNIRNSPIKYAKALVVNHDFINCFDANIGN